ncbi:MAG: chromosome segregation protein SMC [Planctomycetes bacterium]|nr:chromosome segregation protein SMC [Planctomycetota bacterium]
MFLKSITVLGFKSFADKVTFDFGGGVTCIVGPNGCGKSNIVDAFKWVLGEQSARALRGRQMGDMIFNGSSTRRSSSVARVDLVFDNADRRLPLDHAEITVTRKLYRSGDSEYRINGDAARLKDIRELFMDTGVGTEAYSVIEQGRVDVLLQSSPVDRRFIFEEAAGISKYKARKREAQRKLDRTQQNLLRVADIVEELEKRLRSVKLQAGKARNYKEYENRLNELQSTFAMAEYHRLSQTMQQRGDQAQSLDDEGTAVRAKIGGLEAEEVEITTDLDRLAERINACDNELIRAKSDVGTHEERVASATNRIEEQQTLLESARQRRETDALRRDETERELRQTEDSTAAILEKTSELHEQSSELNERDRALARDVTEAQAILEDEKAGIIELLRKSAQTHNEIVRLSTHRESLVGQKGRLSERHVRIAAELETLLEQKATLKDRLSDVEELIAAETIRLEEKKIEASRVDALRQQLVDEIAGGKENRSALLSRRELLEDLEKKMEGVGAAARMFLELKASGDPACDCIARLVAEVIDTDVEHATIIEAALGESAENLIVTDSRAFLARSAHFGDLPGRMTALCVDRLPPLVNAKDFSEKPGFVSSALDLIRCPQEFDTIARHLLGKTIVVDTLETAVALAREDVHGHRFVTLHSDVVEPDGCVRLGPASAVAGLISRRSELRDIEGRMSSLEQRILTLTDQLNRTEADAGHLVALQQQLRTAIYECNTAKVEASAGIQNVDESILRITSEQPVIAQELTMLETEINDVHRKTAENGQSLEALEAENKQRESQVAKRKDRIDALVDIRREVQEQLTELRVELGQLAEKRHAAAERGNALRHQMNELENSVVVAGNDVERCAARIVDARSAIEASREKIERLQARTDELVAQGGQVRKEREEVRIRGERLGQSVKESRSALEALDARLHECQMAMTETKVHRDELVTRVQADLSISLSERYEEYEHSDQDWEAVETEIGELRGKIARLGNVNLDAITELEELEQRHGFLTEQRDDLTTSHRQLEQLIEKLNVESIKRFTQTFEEIREHFRTLFRKLFGGGRADIILEDPSDILECGIEILAQPPGKELQSITLMSGGEKTMTAIALLMSIFRTRPAPFAILDEVDAALDETNNERFNKIIQEFLPTSQFIIVTHSKTTMGVADRLYGVTMQEAGVSTLVGVQLTDTHVA